MKGLVKNYLLYIWQLPQNIIGLLLFYVYYKDGNKVSWYDLKVNVKSKKMKGGITLGKYIIISNVGSLNHEYGHTIQSKILGPLYLPVIGVRSLIHAILHSSLCGKTKSYYHFWTEKWANKLSDKYLNK